MENMELLEKILAEVIDTKLYIREHLVTREEFNEKTGELYNHVDGFINLHTTLDQELMALRHKYERLEERLVSIETRLGMAAA